jgi:D-alanine-D-alanine ligase
MVAARYGDPALVEVYIDGREFNVTVLGGKTPRVLPISEIVYAHDYPGPRVLTFAAKWLPDHPAYTGALPVCPAQAPEEVCLEAGRLALEACRAVGAPHYARVDLRSDAAGQLFVLEVNPNPDLSPEAGLSGQAKAAGMSYSNLINTILELALEERISVGRQSTAYAT